MSKVRDLNKDREEWNYRKNLLDALLILSVCEDSYRLPTIKGFILSEVVNGTIEYVGGNAGQIDYQKYRFDRDVFEEELSKYFKEEMKAHSDGRLTYKVKEAITKLCEHYYADTTGVDRPHSTTELYSHLKGFRSIFPPGILESTFSLSHDTITRVHKEVLPLFSEQEKRDIEGISKAMRKYINKDLRFIEQTYHW